MEDSTELIKLLKTHNTARGHYNKLWETFKKKVDAGLKEEIG